MSPVFIPCTGLACLLGGLALAAPISPAKADHADWFDAVFAEADGRFGGVMDDPEAHRVQVLLSEVLPREDGPATLERRGYRVDAEYYYPASSIKIAGCVAALLEVQRRQAAHGPAVTADTPLTLYFADGTVQDADPTDVEGGRITVRQDIRKVCMVSDNPAFNRQFDLVGRDRLNQSMWDAGLASFRLRHQLIGGGPGERRGHPTRHPRVELRTDAGVHTIPPRTSTEPLTTQRPAADYLLGEARVSGGQRVEEPLDFAAKNEVSLVDLQDLLVMIARPDIDLNKPGLPLTDEHRALLIEAMTQDPLTSANPVYPSPPYKKHFAETWFKDGLGRVVDRDDVRETEKGGTAYGFMIENAYFVHEPTGRAFFLTATVYANPNATLNDGEYGYPQSRQFLADLGEAVARKLWSAPGDDAP